MQMIPTTPRTTPNTSVIQSSIFIPPEPALPIPAIPNNPIPAHLPSLNDTAWLDTHIHPLISKMTQTDFFESTWDLHYDINKLFHLDKLQDIRTQLLKLHPLPQNIFDDMLTCFEKAKLTFMLHNTLLSLVPSFANGDESILNTYKNKGS